MHAPRVTHLFVIDESIHANVRWSIPLLTLASEVCRNKSMVSPVSSVMRNAKLSHRVLARRSREPEPAIPGEPGGIGFSYGSRPARILAQKRKMENHDDWTQDARHGSSDIDNLGNLRTCAGCNFRTGKFSGDVSKSGCAEWRSANSRRPNGLAATWWGFRGKQCLCSGAQRWSGFIKTALCGPRALS